MTFFWGNLPSILFIRRVWRYQRGNQNPYIEDEQITQWSKEKVQKEKQRSTKHINKTKDRVPWTPLKARCELRCSGGVSSSCSTSETRRVEVITSKVVPWLGWPLWNICVTNDHGYVPLVVNPFRFLPHAWLITGFLTRLTRRVSLVEQELLTPPEHLSSHLAFSGVRVAQSSVFCVEFCIVSFGHVIH
jgi:hypothetical protein